MKTSSFAILTTVAALGLSTACAPSDGDDDDARDAVSAGSTAAPLDPAGWPLATDTRLFAVDGLVAPEAVRYDPADDVYFIGNWGRGDDEASDGFISRVAAEDGAVLEPRWVEGSQTLRLQEPRGMVLTGDTLWVVDVGGVHAFHRRSGEVLGFVDLTATEPGFLNDVAADPDGRLWVTDTGTSRVIRIDPAEALSGGGAGDDADPGEGPEPSSEGPGWRVAVEGPRVGNPNGITWDADARRLVLAPWEPGGDSLRSLDPASLELTIVARSPAGLRFDGIEPVPGRVGTFVVASQADSSLHLIQADRGAPWQRVGGRPADIAVDTRRNRVAVPYVADDRVDVYALPGG